METLFLSTIAEVINDLLEIITEEQKNEFREMADFEEFMENSFMLGMIIRNRYGLWQGNDVLLNEYGSQHLDKASMVIITKLWQVLCMN